MKDLRTDFISNVSFAGSDQKIGNALKLQVWIVRIVNETLRPWISHSTRCNSYKGRSLWSFFGTRYSWTEI
jgi:hypothetical protein